MKVILCLGSYLSKINFCKFNASSLPGILLKVQKNSLFKLKLFYIFKKIMNSIVSDWFKKIVNKNGYIISS